MDLADWLRQVFERNRHAFKKCYRGGGGQIEPSDSPSPVVLVTKKDGSTPFCVDYRRLNALTTKDVYLFPQIEDSLRLLGNQQWFCTMDLASGYWQVAMSPEAKRKAAFVTNEGLFQFRVIPFGLCNAPATFERLTDQVLCGMWWSRCLVYLDDVISFARSIPEALARLEEVLGRLSDFGLQLKANKCTFMQTEVIFWVTVWAGRGWCVTQRSYQRCGTGMRQQTAFDSLEACLISAPILGFPMENGRFVLDTDASLFAVGGVLNQLQDDREVVIAYASRILRLSQRRYCTTRRDMLAAVVMCTHFRSYLRGLSLPFGRIIVLSDGSRSFVMEIECWLAGTCCCAIFGLLSNIVRGLSMPMWMVCLDSVDSVRGRIVRFLNRIRRWPNWIARRSFWISPSPRRRSVILWTQTCCRNCRGRPGWQPHCWRDLRRTYIAGGTYDRLASGGIRS